MLGINFLKTRPTDYVLLYKKGVVKKRGAGLSFFYYAPSASLVIVPADSRDEPFIFKETTSDFQEIDIQGQITYRVPNPEKLAAMLDFSVDVTGRYTGDGIEKLPVRLTNLVQVTLREKLKDMPLQDALAAGSVLVSHARASLAEAPALEALGIEVLDFSILKISPTPEISRALEATARENLLKEADSAIYERRNFAVEQERRIQENELQTKISIEEKNRMIREEQMNANLAVERKQGEIEELKLGNAIEREEKRKELVESQSNNSLISAKARAEAVKLELQALTALSPDLLEILANQQMDSRKLVSRALTDLARNSQKIGNLNISPELLNSLLGDGSS